MKMNKKIMVVGISLMLVFVVIAGVLTSGITNIKNQEKDGSDEEVNLKESYVFSYNPEILLPEVFVGSRTIWGSNVNLTNWYELPYPGIFIEKYQNHSKEIIEIMKMQVALLGEDPELFEKCILRVQDKNTIFNSSNNPEDFSVVLCYAWKGNLSGSDIFGEDAGKEVWEITYAYRANSLVEMVSYYVDINTLEILPWTICTD